MSRSRTELSYLAEVVAPRDLEASIASARGMFGALAGESISLEIATGAAGPRWYVRSATEAGLERALAQLRAAYPQGGPSASRRTAPTSIRSACWGRSRPPWSSCGRPPGTSSRSAATGGTSPHRSTGVLARAAPRGDERVVCRLTLGPAPAGAAGRLHRRAAPAGAPRREPAGDRGRARSRSSGRSRSPRRACRDGSGTSMGSGCCCSRAVPASSSACRSRERSPCACCAPPSRSRRGWWSRSSARPW